MAQQLTLTGTNPYIAIINMDGEWWNTDTAAFEVYESGNWADYAISGTEYGSADVWNFTFPATIVTGYYDVVQFNGAIPAEGDTVEAIGTFYWDLDSTKLTVVELVDAATAGAEAIRIELDNNSTKLASIDAKTSRMQFTDDDNLIRARNDLVLGVQYVDHDYGGADALQVIDDDGNPEENTTIRAYLKSDYDAGNRATSYAKGEDTTDINGHWNRGMYLPLGDITLVFIKTGFYIKTRDIVVA